MRIGLVTQDTRGGVQPYAALAAGLADAGHEVLAVAPSEYAWLFDDAGVEVHSLEGMSGEASREVALRAQQRGGGGLREAGRAIVARMPDWTRGAREFLDGVDLLAGGVGGAVMGVPLAQALGVRWIPAHLQPVDAATRRYPGPLFGRLPAGPFGVGNLLGNLLTNTAMVVPLRGPRLAAARTLGVSGRVPAAPASVYGISRHVVEVPSSRHTTRTTTGYWFDRRDEPNGASRSDRWSHSDDVSRVDRSPDELEAFLAAAGPVVSVGFGSMAIPDPAGTRELVVGAARDAGARILLIGGAEPAGPAGSSEDVLRIGSAPHDRVFPRAAVNVHHGGAGTTAAALAAGVPSVVVPFGADQPFWARRAHELGVAPQAPSFAKLTRPALASAIGRAMTDDALRDRAAQLGELIRAEDGVATAVRWFEEQVR